MSNETFPSSGTSMITSTEVVRIKSDGYGPCGVLVEVELTRGATTYRQARAALHDAVRAAERRVDAWFV